MLKGLILTTGFLVLSACSMLAREIQPKTFAIEKRWVVSTLVEEHLGFRNFHRMTPLVTEDTIYQGNANDSFTAYRRKSGTELWKLKISGGVESGASLAGGNLYFGASDGFFYSVDSENGNVNWTFPIRAEGLGKPLVTGNVVYFLAGNNVAYALDTKSGKQIWMYNRRSSSSLSVRGGSQPALLGKHVFFGFSDGFIVALNKANGSMSWERKINRNKRFNDVDAQPIVEGGKIYVASYDGALYCLDHATGNEIWRTDYGSHSTVTLTKDRLYYSTSSGEVIAVRKDTGKIIWKYKLKLGIASRPKIFRGLVVFGESEGAFRVLDAVSGEEVGDYFPGRGIASSPFVDSKTGEAYFISSNANLFALRMAWLLPQEQWPWDSGR